MTLEEHIIESGVVHNIKKLDKKTINCPNCGAPLEGYECRFCGSEVIEFSNVSPGKIVYIRVNDFFFKVQISECKINVYPDALPELTLDASVLETVRVESEARK